MARRRTREPALNAFSQGGVCACVQGGQGGRSTPTCAPNRGDPRPPRPGARWLFALPVPCGAQLFIMRRARRPHDKRTVCFGTTRATKIITRSSSTLHQGVPRASGKLGGKRSKQGGGKGHDTSWPLSCTAIQSTCCLHVGQVLERLVNHGRMQSAQYQWSQQLRTPSPPAASSSPRVATLQMAHRSSSFPCSALSIQRRGVLSRGPYFVCRVAYSGATTETCD